MVNYYGQARPDELRISGSKWKVEWFADIKEMGLCDFKKQKITVSKDVSPELAVDVLVHEIMHVIWWFSAMPGKADEERCISILASGLNQVYAANPLLVEWIGEIHSS
jgi:hypothetical protein